MKFSFSVLPVLLLLSLTLCAQKQIITIMDAEDNHPLVDANLRIGMNIYLSNAKGQVNFPMPKSDTVELAASYLGYKTLYHSYRYESLPDTIRLQRSFHTIDEMLVRSTRARTEQPITSAAVSKETLDKMNFGQDMPVLLDQQTSVNTATDAGNGVGYTYMRIRGSDQSRINVTLNGIPYNDPESQNVYWVDLPDIASSVDNIQIQRGLGTSTNGAAAFGGSVNVNTNTLHEHAYAELNNAVGSYGTLKNSLAMGTGLIKNHFTLDARLSDIRSDGYIDRASSQLLSYFVSAAYHGNNSSIRINQFAGKEKTYQAWYGVPEDSLSTNRTFNPAGTDNGQLSPAYKNQTDNYYQSHTQLLFTQNAGKHFNVSGNAFYSRGKGYYEEYKANQLLSNYGFNPVITDHDTINSTNLVRQRWLSNHFYGFHLALEYHSKRVNWLTGFSWNQYKNQHYGTVIWASYSSSIPFDNRYYSGDGFKTDINAFTKLTYSPIKSLNLFVDLQFRHVDYLISGINDDMTPLNTTQHYNFFNPKVGITKYIYGRNKLYAYAGIGHREPTRDDFAGAKAGITPKPEAMLDVELGYMYTQRKNYIGANLYFMGYKNQLVLTGELNDIGNYVRFNVPRSYRAGIELEGSITPHKVITLTANATFSLNKVMSYTETIYTYDPNYSAIDSLKLSVNHKNTNISFSPAIIAALTVALHPKRNLEIAFINKFVGRQYMDNSQDIHRSIAPYLLNNILISYTLHAAVIKDIKFSLLLNNITNRKYVNNGYTYTERYASPGYLSSPTTYNTYYPQATFNVMGAISFKF
jgi:iron complex outermembrane recepter protein